MFIVRCLVAIATAIMDNNEMRTTTTFHALLDLGQGVILALIKCVLPGYLFMITFLLIIHISESQLHRCMEEICGSIISQNERFLPRLSHPFRPYNMT